MSERVGELLVRENLISIQQLQKAQEEQKKGGGKLSTYLTKLGYINESDLTQFLAEQYNVPAINLEDFEIEDEVIKLVPKEVAFKHRLIPVNRVGASLIVAMVDPSDLNAADDIKFLTGYNVEIVVASEVGIQEAINLYYLGGKKKHGAYSSVIEEIEDEPEEEIDFSKQEDMEDIEEQSADAAPVVKLVNLVLLEAIKKGASDIHVEPYEKDFRVRYRIDGVLSDVLHPPMKLRNAVISRFKIMASMDIAEKRLPQDGRIKLKLGKGREMDFRVSVIPTLYGEKIVLRLLDKENLQLDMTRLGFEETSLSHFKKAIHMPYGMVLVTGPTGSGKTTTLYSALNELNQVGTNIMTAEDPVEYNFFGINQVQMHEDIGLNFAASLRAFLRQDPDIIMVGEIRDFETAEIAIKAALTGHLVLSTLHTNDAPSSVSRLINMGVEPFLVTASVNLILAQRLCRKVCQECKSEDSVSESILKDVQVKPEDIGKFKVYKGQGCKNCSNTGYKGRIAVYEVMPFTEGLKDAVINGATTSELKHQAIREGMQTLRMSAVNKLKEGMTTIEEVTRTTAPD